MLGLPSIFDQLGGLTSSVVEYVNKTSILESLSRLVLAVYKIVAADPCNLDFL